VKDPLAGPDAGPDKDNQHPSQYTAYGDDGNPPRGNVDADAVCAALFPAVPAEDLAGCQDVRC